MPNQNSPFLTAKKPNKIRRLIVIGLLLMLVQSCADVDSPEFTSLIHIHYINGNIDTVEIKGRNKPYLFLTVNEGVSVLNDGFTTLAVHVASFHIIETKEKR